MPTEGASDHAYTILLPCYLGWAGIRQHCLICLRQPWGRSLFISPSTDIEPFSFSFPPTMHAVILHNNQTTVALTLQLEIWISIFTQRPDGNYPGFNRFSLEIRLLLNCIPWRRRFVFHGSIQPHSTASGAAVFLSQVYQLGSLCFMGTFTDYVTG